MFDGSSAHPFAQKWCSVRNGPCSLGRARTNGRFSNVLLRSGDINLRPGVTAALAASNHYFNAFSLQLIYIYIYRPPPLFFSAFSEAFVSIIISSSSSSSSSLSLSIFHSPLLLSALRLIASLCVCRSAHLSSALCRLDAAGREPTHVRHHMLFASHSIF